jgi:hypothetical protein
MAKGLEVLVRLATAEVERTLTWVVLPMLVVVLLLVNHKRSCGTPEQCRPPSVTTQVCREEQQQGEQGKPVLVATVPCLQGLMAQHRRSRRRMAALAWLGPWLASTPTTDPFSPLTTLPAMLVVVVVLVVLMVTAVVILSLPMQLCLALPLTHRTSSTGIIIIISSSISHSRSSSSSKHNNNNDDDKMQATLRCPEASRLRCTLSSTRRTGWRPALRSQALAATPPCCWAAMATSAAAAAVLLLPPWAA